MSDISSVSSEFCGYPLPTSNTTYVPNQFFDVVLAHSSRSCTRLLAYMLRRTLGWCDADGNPQEQRVSFSYSELVKEAGLSRDSVRSALNEAIAANFIRCLREPRASQAGEPAVCGIYELCWDESGSYITAAGAFQGFFAGNGNLTYIPNTFFDYTVQQEPLCVVKVVGAIIRHTIGFQTKYGMRRQKVQLSFSDLQRITKISSRTILSQALAIAMEHKHVVRLSEGRFDSAGGRESEAATYGIRWNETSCSRDPKSISDETHGPGGKVYQSENCTSPKSVPAPGGKVYRDQSEKCTGIEIKDLNKTIKQQQQENAAVLLLLDFGFSKETAYEIAEKYPEERIRKQIELFPSRSPARNRLGLLRRAIQEDWAPVESSAESKEKATGSQPGAPKPVLQEQERAKLFASHVYAAWAGNTGDPAALPSYADRESAELFLRQSCPNEKTEASIILLAKDFGRFIRSAERSGKPLPRSVAIALRSLGDEFIQQKKRRQDNSFAHRTDKTPNIDHLRALSLRVKRDRPALFASFLATEEQELERLQSNRLCSKEGLAKAVEMFLSEGAHLQRLYMFLRKQHKKTGEMTAVANG